MLLVVQLVLVLSIAEKYVYERKVCPRVWVRTAQIDPNLPFGVDILRCGWWWTHVHFLMLKDGTSALIAVQWGRCGTGE